MDELSFGEWKWATAGNMDRLIALEGKKRQLAEHLFFLELHQEASFKQYQKLLSKLGSFAPLIERRKPQEYTIPQETAPDTSQAVESIKMLKTMLDKLRSDFQDSKDRLVLANFRSSALSNIVSTTREVPEAIPVDTPVEIPADLFEKRSQDTIKRLELSAKIEKNWREIELLKELEVELQNEAEILSHVASNLVYERKWHLSRHTGPKVPTEFSFHRESLSLF
jgi:hypothetical protein